MHPTPEQPTPDNDGPDGDQAVDAGVEARLRRLRDDVDLLGEVVRDFMHPGGDDGPQPGPAAAPVEPAYPGLEEWVVEHFARMFTRPLSPALRWCPQWWAHAEALSRLEALWRTWEAARLDPLQGIAVWYRDFADPQLLVLFSPAGPFAQCTADRHSPDRPLPTIPAPDGHWDDDEPDGQPLPDDSPYQPPAARNTTPAGRNTQQPGTPGDRSR